MNTAINMEPLEESASEMYNEGRSVRSREKDAQEKKKVNTLRVGTSGCLTKDNYFIGTNPWKVLARFMGYQTKTDPAALDIFDQGFANEVLWEENVKASGRPFKCEEDYPLVIDVGKYKVTGRPDMVVGLVGEDEFVPDFGVELKAIASTNTKVLKTLQPKTDNLIQAAVYSMGFGIPWSLVYTQGFHNYSLRAGKAEFKLGWDKGNLYFTCPEGRRFNTVITAQGIIDFWTAIIEAYEARDHSFFNRYDMGWDGEDEKNWDHYDSLLLAVDSNLPFDEWEEKLKLTCDNDWIMQYHNRKNRQEGYYLKNVLTGQQSKVYYSKEECREVLWKRTNYKTGG